MSKNHMLFNFILSPIVALVVASASQASAFEPGVPSLKKCAEPIVLHINESNNLISSSTLQFLRATVEAKGHRVTTSADLDRAKRILRESSFVFQRDAALSLAIYSKEAEELQFPMSLAAFKATHAYENLKLPIVKQEVIDRIFAELAAIDRKRLLGTITESEKNQTIASFFNEDIFVDDKSLEGLTATYVMAYSPHLVVPRFETLFWLEAGHGNDDQILVVGTTVNAIEAKRRAQKAIVFYNVTIGELGAIHEVSNLPSLLSQMLAPVESGSLLVAADVENYYRQFISKLPNCKKNIF